MSGVCSDRKIIKIRATYKSHKCIIDLWLGKNKKDYNT